MVKELRINSRIMNASGVLSFPSDKIRGLGAFVTKSISVERKEGNENPVMIEAEHGFINRMGLPNPGCHSFAEELKEYTGSIPLIISVFGFSANEYVKVIKALEEFAIGFELNFSCPNVTHGTLVSTSKKLIKNYMKRIRDCTEKILIPKLSPLSSREIGRICQEQGADAITLSNTFPTEKGGLSGQYLKFDNFRRVKSFKKVLKIPIIACGGISSNPFQAVTDIKMYKLLGASFFQIGSGFAYKTVEEINKYLSEIKKLLSNNKKIINPPHKVVRVINSVEYAKNIKLIMFSDEFSFIPGQYVMVWIPGVGEKPFSLADNNKLLIKKVGRFTEELFCYKKILRIRGPYGKGFPVGKFENKNVLIVAGGVGIAPVLSIPKFVNANLTLVQGAKTKSELIPVKGFGKRVITTDDGSEGLKGSVLVGLESLNCEDFDYACICGPEKMEFFVCKYLKDFILPKNIFVSLERYIKCGVGLCGACECSGFRACTDGPVFSHDILLNTDFGYKKRDRSGVKCMI